MTDETNKYLERLREEEAQRVLDQKIASADFRGRTLAMVGQDFGVSAQRVSAALAREGHRRRNAADAARDLRPSPDAY